MKRKALILLQVVLLIFVGGIYVDAQKKKGKAPIKHITKQRRYLYYDERYQVLANDTAVWDGTYQMIFRGKAIEKGQYHRGKRSGVWEFFTLTGSREFCYDYDENLPFQITPHFGTHYDARNFPPLFLGSPIVINQFLAMETHYKLQKDDDYHDCKVELLLHINTNGRMVGYEFGDTSIVAFNDAVRDAVSRIPDNWRWVPARSNGRNVDGLYKITVIFDAVY